MKYELHFKGNDYDYADLKTNTRVSGHYVYRVLDKDKGIAVVTCHEIYHKMASDYELLLSAKDPSKFIMAGTLGKESILGPFLIFLGANMFLFAFGSRRRKRS